MFDVDPSGAAPENRIEAIDSAARVVDVDTVACGRGAGPSQVPLAGAIAALEAAVAGGVDTPMSAPEAVTLLQAAERLRRLSAVCVGDAVAAVQHSGVHYDHGHRSAGAMLGHTARSSSADVARLDKTGRMLKRCEVIADAWRDGRLSVDQIGVLARAFANPRVRAAFIERQQWFVDIADRRFKAFERRVSGWVNLVDVDGPEPRPEPGHRNRDVSLVQDHFSQQWNLRGTFGSLQGAKIRRALDAYVEAETLADWQACRDEHGDAACRDLLARTDAQRRADAFEQIVADAIHNPNRSVAVEVVHNVVWSAESLEALLRRFAGDHDVLIDPDTHRCHNLDGHPLDANGAFGDFLVSQWRRVVQNAQGITIDISASQRFFTGLARLGVMLSHESCYWPCDVPVTACQIDHLKPAARGGPTTQCNGGPACQRHNRHKERGYTLLRLPDGTLQITTPQGDIIPQ